MRVRLSIATIMVALCGAARAGEPPPAYCAGEYAEELSTLAPKAREIERQSYSFCVRSTAVYECLSYGSDGAVRRARSSAVQHGTAFAYRKDGGDTLLLTNEHVAEWPPVTDQAHVVDGVPAGCKRVSQNLRIVDNEQDGYENDDVVLQRVVSDARLDAAVLRAKTSLPILPWKIGSSAALHERDVVEVRGFPLGAFQATNIGKVISAFQHDDEQGWDHDDFVIDALLSAGNSGSPVLAVSCRTGALELVGIYHAGYKQGSALNVVVGIDQLRDLMDKLQRAPSKETQAAVGLDGAARKALARAATVTHDPVFPLGSLTASVHARSDGALVFQVFRRDFPFRTRPLFAFEDLPTTGDGDGGRVWFGGDGGLKAYMRRDLDADGQALLTRVAEALRSDALQFFNWRGSTAVPAKSRADFERLERAERELRQTVAARRDLVSTLIDLADRMAPQDTEHSADVTELFTPPTPRAPVTPTTVAARPNSGTGATHTAGP